MPVKSFFLGKFKVLIGFITVVILHFFVGFADVENETFWLKVTFYFVVIYLLIVLFFYLKKPIFEWLFVSLNPELMPFVRVLYGVLCLISACQHFSLISSGTEPYNFLKWGFETPSFIAYFLSSIHILALVFIIIGFKTRLAFIVLFITGGAIIPFSLEIFVKNIFNFYAMFLPSYIWSGVRRNNDKNSTGWPLLLMALSYSILMTSAGIFKLFDPVWQSGLGLYYSLNIPFFLPKYLWFILENEFLIKLLNIITLLFELISLPLLLFRKTRLFAIITLIGLGLFLTFVMEGIGIMGGPIIIVACMAIFAITPYPKALKYKFSNLFNFFEYKNVNKFNFTGKWLALIVFWWTIFGVYVNFYNQARNSLNFYPPKYGNFIVNSKQRLAHTNSISVRLKYLKNILKICRPPEEWEFIWTLQLFNYHHLFDRVYFRIVFTNQDGTEKELVEFFDEDGAISWNQPLPGNEKFILSAFRMMDGLRTTEFKETGVMSNAMTKELKGLIMYCINKAGANINNFVKAEIQIKQVFQPYTFKGNFKPWTDSEWIDFYNYDLILNKGILNREYPIYDYSKLSIDNFKNRVIEPNF